MAKKKRRKPSPNRSDFATAVNLLKLVGLEKRDTIVGAKVEGCIKKAISLVLKLGQTPSAWIRETIIRRLREEAS